VFVALLQYLPNTVGFGYNLLQEETKCASAWRSDGFIYPALELEVGMTHQY
jgi:hypothetical protein